MSSEKSNKITEIEIDNQLKDKQKLKQIKDIEQIKNINVWITYPECNCNSILCEFFNDKWKHTDINVLEKIIAIDNKPVLISTIETYLPLIKYTNYIYIDLI